MSNKIVVVDTEYEMLVVLAKQGVYNSNKISQLERENKKLASTNSYVESKQNSLHKENINLKSENGKLKKTVKSLKDQCEAMYEVLKRHNLIPEAKETFRNMKGNKKEIRKSKSMDMER